MTPDFDTEIAAARKRISAMDEIDGIKDREPKTILLSLEAGLKRPETGCQYDALVMLQDVVNGGVPC